MDAESSPLLTQLRDIHAAAEPGWWPPALGWWLLAGLALVLLALAVRLLVKWLSFRRRRRRWLRALEALNRRHDPDRNPREHLAALNRFFRAVALAAFPTAGCARLHGEKWVDFIRSRMPEETGPDALRPLAHGPYEPLPEFDADALTEGARTWVRLHG